MNRSELQLVHMLRDALANLSGVACDINMPEPPALIDAAKVADQAMEAADVFLKENKNAGLYDPWQDSIAAWISQVLRDEKNDAQANGRDLKGEIVFSAQALLAGALSMPTAQMSPSDVDRAEQCARRYGLAKRDRAGVWEFVLPPKVWPQTSAA